MPTTVYTYVIYLSVCLSLCPSVSQPRGLKGPGIITMIFSAAQGWPHYKNISATGIHPSTRITPVVFQKVETN